MGVCSAKSKLSHSSKHNYHMNGMFHPNTDQCNQAFQIYHKFNNLMELIGDVNSLPEEDKAQIKVLNRIRNSMMVIVYQVENQCDGYSKENFVLKGLNLFEEQMKLIYQTLDKLERMPEFYVYFPILSVSFQGILDDIDRYFQRTTVILTPLDQGNQTVKKYIFKKFKKISDIQHSHIPYLKERVRSSTEQNLSKQPHL